MFYDLLECQYRQLLNKLEQRSGFPGPDTPLLPRLIWLVESGWEAQKGELHPGFWYCRVRILNSMIFITKRPVRWRHYPSDLSIHTIPLIFLELMVIYIVWLWCIKVISSLLVKIKMELSSHGKTGLERVLIWGLRCYIILLWMHIWRRRILSVADKRQTLHPY